MASIDEQVLRTAKEIVVKFIETGRVSPAGFPDIFNKNQSVEPSPETPLETEEVEPKKDEPKQDDDVEKPDDVDSGSPTSTPTDTPSPEDEPTATHTPTSTPSLTPTIAPTATKKPTATSTPTNTPKVGPPMTFQEPAWELVEWHQIEGTGEWEGTIRARITGGTPPYRTRLETNEIVTGLDMPVRWRLCKPMPATIRVFSADGQEIHTAIWVYELGCP